MDHLALLHGEVAAMTRALYAADLTAPIPSCPGWTVADLAAHLTGVHRWALAALRSDTPPPYDESPAPGDAAEAYAAAAQELLLTLAELPPDHVCWTFDRNNRSASFWRRRQVHEISVHRWDVEPYALTDEVAEDGVDEVVDFMLPRQLATGRASLPGGSLELRTDRRTWTVGDGEPRDLVEGSAGDVLLALWGRGTPLPEPWASTRLTP